MFINLENIWCMMNADHMLNYGGQVALGYWMDNVED